MGAVSVTEMVSVEEPTSSVTSLRVSVAELHLYVRLDEFLEARRVH